MQTKLMIVFASVIISSLLFSVYQPGNAVSQYGHDGSVDEYLTKIKSEQQKRQKEITSYRMMLGGIV